MDSLTYLQPWIRLQLISSVAVPTTSAVAWTAFPRMKFWFHSQDVGILLTKTHILWIIFQPFSCPIKLLNLISWSQDVQQCLSMFSVTDFSITRGRVSNASNYSWLNCSEQQENRLPGLSFIQLVCISFTLQ
jgi:hypothetical protein